MWLVSHKHAQYLLYHLQPAHKPVEVDGNGNEQIKSTKVQTPHVLGEQTDMKTELYQTNVKSQGFIYRASFQHRLH